MAISWIINSGLRYTLFNIAPPGRVSNKFFYLICSSKCFRTRRLRTENRIESCLPIRMIASRMYRSASRRLQKIIRARHRINFSARSEFFRSSPGTSNASRSTMPRKRFGQVSLRRRRKAIHLKNRPCGRAQRAQQQRVRATGGTVIDLCARISHNRRRTLA